MPPFAQAPFERASSADSQHSVDQGVALNMEARSTFLRTASSGSAAESMLSERSRPSIDLGVDLQHESRRHWRAATVSKCASARVGDQITDAQDPAAHHLRIDAQIWSMLGEVSSEQARDVHVRRARAVPRIDVDTLAPHRHK